MFTAVLDISRILSIPIISAIPSTGRFTELNTIVSVIKPTLGTPAVPMDANVAINELRDFFLGKDWYSSLSAYGDYLDNLNDRLWYDLKFNLMMLEGTEEEKDKFRKGRLSEPFVSEGYYDL